MGTSERSEFLIIGSGIAGLSCALRVADRGQVIIVTKKKKSDTATNLAQGGIAAVLDEYDDEASHRSDTLTAGDGLCDYEVVKQVVAGGKKQVEDLMGYGVEFVRQADSNRLSLGKEGGHSHRRVAHAYDLTGKEIESALLRKVMAHPNISIYEDHTVIDLLTTEDGRSRTCGGAAVLTPDEQVKMFYAHFTVLCTGGSGKVYLYTSNPDIATGDGVAIAYRAGAQIANMEFVQFHPTCLYHPQAKNFLISEAARGEGARLLTKKGDRFMSSYDPRAELATRDIVARSIDQHMKESGDDCVYLDFTCIDASFVKKRFPAIHAKCLTYNIDITTDPLPVVPAAHYQCGGVLVDSWGATTINGLLALGEVACTGLHGANRLASNSLLEAVVFAERAAQFCIEQLHRVQHHNPSVEFSGAPIQGKSLPEEILVSHNWDIIRRIMWNYVGIVRREKRLDLAKLRLIDVIGEIEQHCNEHRLSKNMIELRNISHVALLIVEAARLRKESRGLHYCLDYPEKNERCRYWTALSSKRGDSIGAFHMTRVDFTMPPITDPS